MNDQLLSDIAASLRTIANALAKSDGLGFQTATDTTVLYANAGEHNSGWYTLTAPPDRRQVTQPATIKGRIRDVKFLVPDGRKFDKEKMRVYLDCGQAGLIIIEAGADSAFSKSLLASLAAVELVTQLEEAITIYTWVTDKEALMASLTLSNGHKPKMPWDKSTDFSVIREVAVANVCRINGKTPPAPPEEAPGGKRWGVTYSPGPMKSQPAPVADPPF
jgi:hypothetical protein